MLSRLRMLTAGESHGLALVGILDGLPRGVSLSREGLARELRRRREVAGRSARQQLESDDVEVWAGVRHGVTTGAPVALVLKNAEHARWRDTLAPWPDDAAPPAPRVTTPRPGHADLAGARKLGTDDVRDVIERASARETAMRTAMGGLARALLDAVGVRVTSYVEHIGAVRAPHSALPFDALSTRADASPVRALDDDAGTRMLEEIERARRDGDTLGGTFVVLARGMPTGAGSFAQPDLRLSALLSGAVASIPGVKAVAIGDGWVLAGESGRAAHDEIHAAGAALVRPTNHAGGIEGGISNGEDIVVRAVQKPLATVAGGLASVDLATRAPARGHVERSDACAVPAAAVVAEALVALTLADALLVTFGGDTLDELRGRIDARRAST